MWCVLITWVTGVRSLVCSFLTSRTSSQTFSRIPQTFPIWRQSIRYLRNTMVTNYDGDCDNGSCMLYPLPLGEQEALWQWRGLQGALSSERREVAGALHYFWSNAAQLNLCRNNSEWWWGMCCHVERALRYFSQRVSKGLLRILYISNSVHCAHLSIGVWCSGRDSQWVWRIILQPFYSGDQSPS